MEHLLNVGYFDLDLSLTCLVALQEFLKSWQVLPSVLLQIGEGFPGKRSKEQLDCPSAQRFSVFNEPISQPAKVIVGYGAYFEKTDPALRCPLRLAIVRKLDEEMGGVLGRMSQTKVQMVGPVVWKSRECCPVLQYPKPSSRGLFLAFLSP